MTVRFIKMQKQPKINIIKKSKKFNYMTNSKKKIS